LAQFGRTDIEKDKTKFGNCSEELAVPADQFDVVDVIKVRGPTTCGKKNNMMGGRMLHDSVKRRDFLQVSAGAGMATVFAPSTFAAAQARYQILACGKSTCSRECEGGQPGR
jgi:hypothetical protein